MAFKKLFF